MNHILDYAIHGQAVVHFVWLDVRTRCILSTSYVHLNALNQFSRKERPPFVTYRTVQMPLK